MAAKKPRPMSVKEYQEAYPGVGNYKGYLRKWLETDKRLRTKPARNK
jgi:hypothetical protein